MHIVVPFNLYEVTFESRTKNKATLDHLSSLNRTRDVVLTEYVAISLAVFKAYDMNIISNNKSGSLAKPRY